MQAETSHATARPPASATAQQGDARLRKLLDVGRALTSQLDQDVVLQLVLDTARELTGARYAALGVLNEEQTGLARFLTAGMDERMRAAIGSLPHGRGVLGVLIEEPRPLRLREVGAHPTSYGFPAGHPVMHGFLGVPIEIRGRPWGNLYLTEKTGGEFTEHDEECAVTLAGWAGVAIENARLYERSERRRQASEKNARELEATRDIAQAIGSDVDLGHVLELIAKRGRALMRAAQVQIWLERGDQLELVAAGGHVTAELGARLPVAGTISGEVLSSRSARRIAGELQLKDNLAVRRIGVTDSKCVLIVPMLSRGRPVGVISAFDGGTTEGLFSEDDEHLLSAFAASAANAVMLAQSVEGDRLRVAIAAGEEERGRWARELHDETLQSLAGLRIRLSSTLRSHHEDIPPEVRAEIAAAIEHVEADIESLRGMISELRPASLDELGLLAAIESMLERQRGSCTFAIESSLELPGQGERLDRELESTAYRLIQEAITNASKHARADRVTVRADIAGGVLRISVQDDGRGFDVTASPSGFGLTGMRERVGLAGGTLDIESGERGTRITALLPLEREASQLPAQSA